MQNIIQSKADNTGGIAKFYFVPVEDIIRIPARSPLGILENIEMAAGKVWYEFHYTRETLSFKEPENLSRAGTKYKQELKGYIARETPELQQLLAPLRGRRFVCLVMDHNNEFPILIGTKQYYLTFETELDTRNSYAGGTGRSFSFKGESAIPSCFYRGAFEVSGTGVIEPPQTGQPVRFMKENGEVIALVQPGRDLIIGSGFKLRYRIE